MPSAELLAAMGKYNEELIEAGVLQGGGGPSGLGHCPKHLLRQGRKMEII